jgi:hypothetical protein
MKFLKLGFNILIMKFGVGQNEFYIKSDAACDISVITVDFSNCTTRFTGQLMISSQPVDAQTRRQIICSSSKRQTGSISAFPLHKTPGKENSARSKFVYPMCMHEVCVPYVNKSSDFVP